MNALFDFGLSHVHMQQRRCLQLNGRRAASAEGVVRDAAITEFIAPPPKPALRLVTQFDFTPHKFTVSESSIHSLTSGSRYISTISVASCDCLSDLLVCSRLNQ